MMNNQPMQFMQMAPLQKNNQAQMAQLLQAALARGASPGGAPAAAGPAQGAQLPGGAMNLVPPQANQMGLLARLFRGAQGAQPGAPLAAPMDSTNALY